MYKGYIDINPSHEEWAELYTNPENNAYGCLDNQYLIIHNEDGSIEDRFKWVDGGYKKLSYKQINNSFISKIKPRNIQQECAFDLLQDKNTTIKILTGRFGSGKTFLMASNALQLITDNKFEKIVWVRNNIGRGPKLHCF